MEIYSYVLTDDIIILIIFYGNKVFKMFRHYVWWVLTVIPQVIPQVVIMIAGRISITLVGVFAAEFSRRKDSTNFLQDTSLRIVSRWRLEVSKASS